MTKPGQKQAQTVAKAVRSRIQAGGNRLWRVTDFANQRPSAVARTLSRLAKQGVVRRLSKGVYYPVGQGIFGEIRPNPRAVQALAADKGLFPAGTTAANVLGFSTQVSGRPELSTVASSVPRKLLGPDTIIHTRRPRSWAELNGEEAAILDLLRRRGLTSELPPNETIRRTIRLLTTRSRYAKLAKAALQEPPRVRAILGALGETMKADKSAIMELRRSLNPLSTFDFGAFSALPNARAWQAKRSSK